MNRVIQLRVTARTDWNHQELCAAECPCHNFDDDVRHVCGAFDKILEESNEEDDEGNALLKRCAECLTLEIPEMPS